MTFQRNVALRDTLLLLREKGWIKRSEKSAFGYCVVGALREVVTRLDPNWSPAVDSPARMLWFDALEDLFLAVPGQSQNCRRVARIEPVDYNDRPDVTLNDIESWIHAAINVKG